MSVVDISFIFVSVEQDKNGSTVNLSEQPEKTQSIGSSSNTDSSDPNANIAIECAMNGNLERLVRCFDDENDPYHDSVVSLINQRSVEDNKSALDWAALLGNISVVSELIKRGADVNAVSEKGKLYRCIAILVLSVVLYAN